MARKITLFELHFDGARFGPSFGSGSEEEPEATEVDIESGEYETGMESSSGSRLRPVLAIVGVVLAVTVARRLARRRRTSDEEYGIEIDEESEAVRAE